MESAYVDDGGVLRTGVVVYDIRFVCMPGPAWKKLIESAKRWAAAGVLARLAKTVSEVWWARFQAVWCDSSEPGHFSSAGRMHGAEDHMFSQVSSIHSRRKGTVAMALLVAEWTITPGEG